MKGVNPHKPVPPARAPLARRLLDPSMVLLIVSPCSRRPASKSFQCPRSPAASSSSARAFHRRYDPLPQATRSDVRERAHNHSVKMYPRGRKASGALTCEEWTALGF